MFKKGIQFYSFFNLSWIRIRILNTDPDSGGCWIGTDQIQIRNTADLVIYFHFLGIVCWSSAVCIGPWWRCCCSVTCSPVLASMSAISGGRHSAHTVYRRLKFFAVPASLTSFGRRFHSTITLVLKKLLMKASFFSASCLYLLSLSFLSLCPLSQRSLLSLFSNL